MEQIKAMLEAIKNDAVFHGKMQKLIGDAAAIVALAAENGFVFTEDDWKNITDPVSKKELSEESLAAVSGGTGEYARCAFSPDESGAEFTKLYMRDGYVCTRLCSRYNNIFLCNRAACSCFGTECCRDGTHYTNKDGQTSHVRIWENDN